MAGIKIVDLPALGRDLASTDLFEMSIGGTASRKITGQEIMNASKLNVGSTPIVSGTVGRVLFEGTGNVLQQSSSLFWDGTNERLGIGTSSPLASLMVKGIGATSATNSLIIQDSAGTELFKINNGLNAYIVNQSSSNVFIGNTGGYGGITVNAVLGLITSTAYGTHQFNVFNGSAYETAMTIKGQGSSSKVLIGTTTDAGFRLDVNGTARVSGSELRVGSLQLLSSGSPGATGQGITTTGRKISLQSQGEINIDNAAAYQFLGYADSPVAMTQNATGRTVSFVQVKGGFSSPNYNNTQGNLLWINPVYNMGGTTNAGQILRGIYYNPTLTDLTNATHRAIDITSGDFVWGTGYSQYYGNSIEGFIQFNTSGSTTQLWMRPPNNPNNYGTPYYSKISHTNADLTINSGLYGSLYLGANGGSGANTSMVLFNAAANTPAYVLINTTTNAGFRLDVNGTARVSGNLTFGFNTTYITTSSTGGGINAGINTFFNNGAIWIDDTSVRALDITYNNGIKIANTTRYPLSLGTSAKAVASAQLEMVSTTQGFLPPRMTNAQRTAIVSPAVGLIVYCTDVTEGLWVYKSAGWTFIV